MTKFSVSCNLKGEFVDKPVSQQYLFHKDVQFHSKLDKCNKHVNKIDWLENCSDFCQEFRILDFNTKFFSPSMKKYVKLTKFFNDRLSLWEEEEKELNMFKKASKITDKKRRILSVISKKKTRKLNRKLVMSLEKIKYDTEFKRFEDDAVITSPIGIDYDLNKYSYDFKPEGLSLYDIGKNTKLSKGLKKSILEVTTSRKLLF